MCVYIYIGIHAHIYRNIHINTLPSLIHVRAKLCFLRSRGDAALPSKP